MLNITQYTQILARKCAQGDQTEAKMTRFARKKILKAQRILFKGKVFQTLAFELPKTVHLSFQCRVRLTGHISQP